MDNNQPATLLPIDYLQPNPLQPRGVITPESLSELIDSIKTHGIIQPLIVAHTPAGYQIIAGERRWRASRLVGLKEVPVRVIETSPQGMLEMAIVENVQRSDLNPIDRANSFERLQNEFSLSNTDICIRVGKSPAYVSNTLRLLDLPDALKDGLISGVISEGHARALAAIPDTQSMIEAYKIILREGGSVRRAEELARKFKRPTRDRDNNTAKYVLSENFESLASDMQKSIGNNALVKLKQSRIETSIQIVLKGNPEETEEQVKKIHNLLSVTNTTSPSPQPQSESLVREPFSSDDNQQSEPVSQAYRNPFAPFSE